MKALFYPLVFACSAFALSACGGGSSSLSPGNPAPMTSPIGASTATPMPTPTATPMPTSTPTSSAATTTLNNGAPLMNAPLATSAPAPAGYTQAVNVPIVTAGANTKIMTTASTSMPPAGLAPLVRGRAAHYGRDAGPDPYTTIFYDSLMPSANITVAGNISYTTSFPAGTLGSATSYYLGFYDTTQASPAWQTIAGPVTPTNGTNLTFSGSVSSITLLGGKLYGFAIFSTVAPTATPPPAPQTNVYFGDDTGLHITSESGAVINTLAIPNNSFDLDDSGNVYAFYAHQGGTSPNSGGTPAINKYLAGSSTATASYTQTKPNDTGVFVVASGAGELAAVHSVSGNGTLSTDVWDPGASGTPSRTLITQVPTGTFAFVMTHDGSLYLPDRTATGTPEFDIFAPGASTPSSTIPETIVPPNQYNNFTPNYAAVGSDGTLYVTEYSFNQPDPNAGLYIYPPGGTERFIAAATNAQGPGPQGVDVDASGNVYVVNNNSGTTSSTTCQGDTLQSVSVYSSAGAPLRTITGGFTGYPITTAADGTSFISSFKTQFLPGCAATGVLGIYAVPPNGSTATAISSSGSTEIVLFDGTHKTEPFARSHGGHGSSR